MSTQVQYRRGTSTQNDAFVGAAGEITVDTTNWLLRVADGVTTGGYTMVGLTATQTITNKVYNGTSVSVSGNVVGGNVTTAGLISATGNITSAANVAGGNVISTALVKGVTISASGNVIGGNVTTAGLISATGNITGGNINAAGLSLSGNVISALNMTTNITTTGNITAGNVSATGNINIAGQLAATVADATALAIALG